MLDWIDMQIAPAKVVNDRLELDAHLPEGTSVTVIALVPYRERSN
jgi:hypothetical protein